MSVAVEVDGVSKRFRLYHEKYTSLKERAIHLGKVPFEEFWALRDIQMEIAEGETVGLLGHNGSGKSTLLKCIAAILQPTSGQILVRGKLAAMLELGAGFHPELSGRDNIFLNASLLGMGKKEIERRFDDIVAFAELEQFIDNQVKYYSSGMYTRLGFAVAVNMEPDVLLVDEVLAVGDENFQRKCLDRIKRFQAEGRTIIFVSHSTDLVRQICDRGFVLDHGRIVAEGSAGEVIRSFREYLMGIGDAAPDVPEAAAPDADTVHPAPEVVAIDTEAGPAEAIPTGGAGDAQVEVGSGVGSAPPVTTGSVRVTSVAVEYPAGEGDRQYMLPGEELAITLAYDAVRPAGDVVVSITMHDRKGEVVFGSSTQDLGMTIGELKGTGRVVFRFDSIPLNDGTYDLTFGITSHDGGIVYAWREQKDRFEVMNPGRTLGNVVLNMKAEVLP
ncbi:MAG: ABC transporter ATP-binding protein [Acidimicrobiales bacterium]